ncbi:MAG: YbaN family protein [Oscillospiraceae bacterium]|jgi:uncharacterized membrane protein YbaN (DUF454 family)|nr:YbaN family protein [Oscillospiraceae bacterium]
MLKALFTALGFLAFAAGTVGIFLPLLPTTPLYLLAAFCFVRGSQKFHERLTGTILYKKHIDQFITVRAMTTRTKLGICIPVSCMLAAAAWFAPVWHAQVLIAAAALFKWGYFIFRIKTIPRQPKEIERKKKINKTQSSVLRRFNQFCQHHCAGLVKLIGTR